MDPMRSWMLDALLSPAAVCPVAWRGVLAGAYLAAADHLMPKWRQTARRNLALAGITNSEEVMRKHQVHLRRLFETLVWMDRLDREWLERMLRVEWTWKIPRVGRRGAIFVGAHFGNWELSAYAKALLDRPGMVLVRRTGCAALDARLDSRRSASGNLVIGRHGASAATLRHLRNGGDVGLMIDTRPDEEARVEVEFLGIRGWAGTTAARMQRITGAEVVCVHTVWSDAEGRYVMHCLPAPQNRGDVESDTAALLRHFEAIIRQYPEQYLWIHNRWAEPKRPGRPGS
jgi:KDO2-lipid IV(A) lauroyltransferase